MQFDVLGNWIFLKRILFVVVGTIAQYRFKLLNNTKITGSDIIRELPKRNVLFVSNHQTYFADVILMFITFSSARNGFNDKLGPAYHLFNANYRAYFIAARETMKAGILPKILAKAGGILVQRTWREAGKNIKRKLNPSDAKKIGDALNDGWVITFPQGTTTPYVPGRKGTAHIIKKFKPIVVPIVIDGFRRAFDKKGVLIKKKGVNISLTIKKPLNIDYDADVETILHQVMYAIEQSEEFYPEKLKKPAGSNGEEPAQNNNQPDRVNSGQE